MTTITIEVPDDLAAKIDPATLPMLLRELVAQKIVKLKAIEESAKQPPPIYREITDFLATSPTADQIIAFKLSAAAQERLEDLLYKNREEALSPEEKAELDAYCELNHLMIKLKARALSQRSPSSQILTENDHVSPAPSPTSSPSGD
jgi:hypothetical protein